MNAIAIKILVVILASVVGFGYGIHYERISQAAAQTKAQAAEVVQGNAVNAQDAAKAQANQAERDKAAAKDRLVAQSAAVAAGTMDKGCAITADELFLLNRAIQGD